MDRKYIYGILAVLAILLAVFFLSGCETGFTEEQVKESIANAVEDATKEMYTAEQLETAKEKAVEGLYTEEQLREAERIAKEGLFNSDEVDAKIQEVLDLREEQEQEEEEKLANVYTIDEIEIGGKVSKVLTDRQIALFDGKIKFDGDDYDAEETLELTDLLQKANGNEFKADTCLVLDENSVKYSFVVENSFDTSLITEGESLKISLLGEEAEIVEWTTDSIKLYKGDKELFEEGETKVIGGIEITAKVISGDKVYFEAGDESATIKERDSEKIGGVEIYVEEVWDNEAAEGTVDFVVIKIGEKVYEDILDGNEYKEDSFWEWNIKPKEISLVLKEEFKYIDEDEDFKALGTGNKLCLPNDYVCLMYDGLVEETVEEYRFKAYTRSGNDYVRVDGNFISGLKDYERVYIDKVTHKIYDKDLVEITGDIELGDTEMELVNGIGYIKIENSEFEKEFRVNYDLSKADANNKVDDISGNEDDYRTDYGIVIKTPKDSLDDEDLKLVIPTEQITGSITLG